MCTSTIKKRIDLHDLLLDAQFPWLSGQKSYKFKPILPYNIISIMIVQGLETNMDGALTFTGAAKLYKSTTDPFMFILIATKLYTRAL